MKPRAGLAWLAGFLCALCATTSAAAQGIEQLDQLEPGRGELQAEYFGDFTGDGSQQLELLGGVTERLALGAEAEFEGPGGGLVFESAGLIALYRFADPDTAPLGIGVSIETGFDREARLSELAGRLILERRTERWWLQGNAIVRHARAEGARGTGIAYGAAISRALRDGLWVGIEGSGQLVRLGGEPGLAAEGAHYAGPSVTAELPLAGGGSTWGEIEIGAAWMVRLAGGGPRSGPRVFVQTSF